MTNYIPRLEWNFIEKTGDLDLGGNVLSNIVDASLIQEGMVVTGSGIPDDTTVVSVNVGTEEVTISKAGTASTADETYTFRERLDFDYPPEKDNGEQYETNEVVSESVSGIRQTQVNAIIAKRPIKFAFISKTIRDRLMDDFYLAWAIYGKDFRFYEHKSEASYKTYHMDKLDFKQEREIPKQDDFLYSHPFTFRRVVL